MDDLMEGCNMKRQLQGIAGLVMVFWKGEKDEK